MVADEPTKRLEELQAIEARLLDYERALADLNHESLHSPDLTMGGHAIRLSGVTQVKAVVGAIRRSVEIEEALIRAERGKGQPRQGGAGPPEADLSASAGDDAVEP